jgi:transcriptional regulator with XRE-family HTH domain
MPEDLLILLGDRIRRLRKKRGWTQVEMAEKVGIDRSFLADVERGKRNVSNLRLDLIGREDKPSGCNFTHFAEVPTRTNPFVLLESTSVAWQRAPIIGSPNPRNVSEGGTN